MGTLENKVIVLDEEPETETLMGGSGSKPEQNMLLDVNKDVNERVVLDVNKDVNEGAVVDDETVVDSGFDGEGVVHQEKEKTVVGNLNSLSNGGMTVSVDGTGVEVAAGGSVDVGIDEKIEDDVDGLVDDVYKQFNGGGSGSSGSSYLSMDVDGEEKDVENLEGGGHDFRVGDFVWGKIKSHPWWPGQIYDPKDASDFAVKHSQEGRLLVAFFGDGSCSWCLPSQLLPFVENFVKMSRDSNSKSFLKAVETAVDEIGRVVESEMICRCTPEDSTPDIARSVVENAGVRAGVLMPEVEACRLGIPEYKPSEILSRMRYFARSVFVDNTLEVAVLRSRLSAMCRFKGGHQLPLYQDPVHIEGLEDKNNDDTAVANDFSVPIEVPISGPLDDDWTSSPGAKPNASLDDKIYQRRKQKSVAELMGENTTLNLKSEKTATLKEETDFAKSMSSDKRKKIDNESVGQGSTVKRGRKRKAEVLELPVKTNENVSNEETSGVGGVGGESEGPLSKKPMAVEVANFENTSSEAKVELEDLSSPRERKLSKYLSPPYTNMTWRIGNSSTKMEPGFQLDKVAKRANGGSGTKNIEKASQENIDSSVSKSSKSVENEKLTFPASDVDVPVDHVFLEVQLAAVNPLYLTKEGSFDMVWAFVSAFRSSTYLHGSNHTVYRKCSKGKKRKSLHSELGTLGNGVPQKKAKHDSETPNVTKTEGKSDTSSKNAAETSGSKTSARKLRKNASSCLIVTFPPGFPLPSKEDIVGVFRKYGSLSVEKTDVRTDSHSAKIVFTEDSDAKAAFTSSVTESPFGSESVTYRLRHSSIGVKSRKTQPKASSPVTKTPEKPESSSPTDDLVSDARAIMKKFEIMTAILENYHSKYSEEDKLSLKEDMKLLMEKVDSVSEIVETASEKVRNAENGSSNGVE